MTILIAAEKAFNKIQRCLFIYLFLKIIYLFYFWLCWVFVSVRGLSLVAASRGRSSSLCAGLSLSRPLLQRSTGSRRAGSVSCGSRAQLLRGMWDLPRPGPEPVSPALAGRFSTAPLGKPNTLFFKILFHYSLLQDIDYSSLCYTVGLCYLSILYIVACICQSQILIYSSPQHIHFPLW